MLGQITMREWALLMVALYLSFWLCRAIYRLYFHPLARYPGSRLAAVSTSWYEWYWNYYQNGQMLFEIKRLHDIYGPVIRIGANDLHVSDPEVYQDLTRIDSGFTKDPYFYQFISLPGTSIGETDPSRHRIRRKVLTPALSGSRIQELAPAILGKTEQLMLRFGQVADSQSTISVPAAAKAFTMDIISKIVLGQEMGCVAEPDFRNEFIDFLHTAFDVGWMGPAFPTLSAIALAVAERVPLSLIPIALVDFKQRCLKITQKYLAKFDNQQEPASGRSKNVEDSKAVSNRSERSAVIDMLMNPRLIKGHQLPTLGELNDELVMLLTAGNDTTSNAMLVGIYWICQLPLVYQRLTDELQRHFPSPMESITYCQAKKLPYLTATIKEVLRLAHPLSGRLPRTVPIQGYSLQGHLLLPGTRLHTSAYILNRHPDVWERPDEFDPDRWLREDSGQLDKHMATFNRGVRQCLGKDLAWCELQVLLANLFRRFHLIPYHVKPKDMEWVDLVLTVFQGEFLCQVKRREA